MNDPGAYGFYEPPGPSSARPAVITWFRVYAATLVLLAGGLLAAFLMMGAGVARMGREVALFQLIFLFFVLVVGAFYGIAAMVPYKPWGWTLGLVAICLGLSSVFVLIAVPLLIYWLKPDTKAAFGRL